MAGVAASLFNGLISGAKSHSSSIGNTAIFLVVMTGEILIGENLFRCPCLEEDREGIHDPRNYSAPNARQFYGISFFVWPAVLLFCIAVLINKETHRCLSAAGRHCNCRRHLAALAYLCRSSAWCVTPPAAWLIIVFIDGRYLECVLSKVPNHCLPTAEGASPELLSVLNITDVSMLENVAYLRADNSRNLALSQVLAWIILGIGGTLTLLVKLCTQLCASTTYYQLHFMNTFRKKEMDTFHRVSEELLDDWLQRKWKKFFHQAQEGDWEAIAGLPSSTPTLEEETYFYSAFHQWEPHMWKEKWDSTMEHNVVNLKQLDSLEDETDIAGDVVKSSTMPNLMARPPNVDNGVHRSTVLDRPSKGIPPETSIHHEGSVSVPAMAEGKVDHKTGRATLPSLTRADHQHPDHKLSPSLVPPIPAAPVQEKKAAADRSHHHGSSSRAHRHGSSRRSHHRGSPRRVSPTSSREDADNDSVNHVKL